MRLLAPLLFLSAPAWAAPGDLAVDPAVDGRAPGTYFFADAERTVVTVEEDAGGLWLNGALRAWRTGDLALKTLDEASARALEAWPEVAYVEAIPTGRSVWRVVAEPGVDTIALSTRIVGEPGVLFCHPDLRMELQPHTLDDPLIDDAWHLHNTGQSGGLAGSDVGAFDAWTTATGAGQIIAIIDTGIDLEHPDLDVLEGYDFGDGDDDPSPEPSYDGHGHGTAMAGVAAAIGDNGVGTAGIAPDAQILPIKFVGDGTSLFEVHNAFVYAADQGAAVLSNSWGYSARGCPEVPLPGLIIEALEYVEEEGRGGLGAAFAMSYGNGGCDASTDAWHEHPLVLTVGAATDLDRRVGYSNYGTGLDIMGFGGGDGRPGLVTTDIVGEAGYTNHGDGAYWYGGSGTSSACASVAGVLALVFEANPRITAADARRVVCETASKPAWEDTGWDEQGWSSNYGCGRIDAAAAVAAVADAGPPEVVPDDPGTQHVSRATLSWTATDPDGTVPAVTVTLVRPSGIEEVLEVRGASSVDVSDLVSAGTTYTWRVQAADAWGPGEAVEGPPLMVVDPPVEEVGACSTGSSSPAWAGLLLALGVFGWRRRR